MKNSSWNIRKLCRSSLKIWHYAEVRFIRGGGALPRQSEPKEILWNQISLICGTFRRGSEKPSKNCGRNRSHWYWNQQYPGSLMFCNLTMNRDKINKTLAAFQCTHRARVQEVKRYTVTGRTWFYVMIISITLLQEN